MYYYMVCTFAIQGKTVFMMESDHVHFTASEDAGRPEAASFHLRVGEDQAPGLHSVSRAGQRTDAVSRGWSTD